jgi:hypothetical protein
VCIHFNQNMLSNDKRLPGSEIGFKNEWEHALRAWYGWQVSVFDFLLAPSRN